MEAFLFLLSYDNVVNADLCVCCRAHFSRPYSLPDLRYRRNSLLNSYKFLSSGQYWEALTDEAKPAAGLSMRG